MDRYDSAEGSRQLVNSTSCKTKFCLQPFGKFLLLQEVVMECNGHIYQKRSQSLRSHPREENTIK